MVVQHGGLLTIEGHAIDHIPARERHGKLAEQGPFWFLGNFHFFTVSIGFVGVGMGLSAGWATLAGALGIMFGTNFMAFHGSQGPEMGLPQMIQSRAQFGYRGVVLPLLATLFVFVGFNVVNVSLIIDGLHTLFGWPAAPVVVVVVAAGALLAVFGHDLMHRAFHWALIASLPLYALVTLALVAGVRPHGAETDANVGAGHFSLVAFATQFAIAASYNISYAPYVSDYTRYLPADTSRVKLIAAIFVGASLSGTWMIGLGAFLMAQWHATDALAGLSAVASTLVPGLGNLVVAVLVLAFLPVIALNTYSAMLTLLTGIDSVRPIRSGPQVRVAAIGAISLAVIACVLGIAGNGIALLNLFLKVMLYFLIPWTAVNLVDYFVVRRGHYAIADLFTPHGLYGAWQARGIISYVAGFAAMVPFFALSDDATGRAIFIGPLARALDGVDVAWLVGLAASAGIYVILSRSLDLAAEARVIAASSK